MRTVADHINDIVQNSIKAGAKNILLEFIENYYENMVKFIVMDDGCGMNEEKLSKIFDPFFTTREHKIRKVGIGLSLLKENCELTGGYVKVESKLKSGTKVEAVFKSDSIDMPAIGNIPQTFLSIINFSNNVDFLLRRVYNKKSYTIDTKELKSILGVSLSEPMIYNDLYSYFEKKEKELVENA